MLVVWSVCFQWWFHYGFMCIKKQSNISCHIKLKSDLNRLIFHDFEWYIYIYTSCWKPDFERDIMLLKCWFRMRYLLENQWFWLNNIIPAHVFLIGQTRLKLHVKLRYSSDFLVFLSGFWGFILPKMDENTSALNLLSFHFTHLKFNSSPLKIDGCRRRSFPFGRVTFQGRAVKLRGWGSPFYWLLEEAPKSFYNFIDTDLEAPTFEWISGSLFAIVGNLGGSASRENDHRFVVHGQIRINYFAIV